MTARDNKNGGSNEPVTWESIPIGEVLPIVEYTLTSDLIENYRKLVGNPTASYPTVAARHPARCFHARYGGRMRLPNMGYDTEYYNPPEPDKRIVVTARVIDKFIRRETKYMIVEARAIDEDGRLIQIDRLRATPKTYDEQAFSAVAGKWETDDRS